MSELVTYCTSAYYLAAEAVTDEAFAMPSVTSPPALLPCISYCAYCKLRFRLGIINFVERLEASLMQQFTSTPLGKFCDGSGMAVLSGIRVQTEVVSGKSPRSINSVNQAKRLTYPCSCSRTDKTKLLNPDKILSTVSTKLPIGDSFKFAQLFFLHLDGSKTWYGT